MFYLCRFYLWYHFSWDIVYVIDMGCDYTLGTQCTTVFFSSRNLPHSTNNNHLTAVCPGQPG